MVVSCSDHFYVLEPFMFGGFVNLTMENFRPQSNCDCDSGGLRSSFE